MKKIFLDSSVLFTAVNSPTGGSAKLFTLETFALTTSLFVLTEVERNIRKKLYTYHLERFFFLTKRLEIIVQKPDQKHIQDASKVIAVKDAVILAEAKQAGTDILATLDKKHFFTPKARSFLHPRQIMSPKEIIEFL